MASPRGFAIGLLAVAGALSGHWIGTTFAAPAELVDHSYLGAAGAVLTPFVIAALAWLAVKGARTAGVARVDLRQLLALQIAVFTSQELVELVSADVPLTSFVTEPAIVLGLLAQIPVALAIAGLVRLARTLAAALVAATGPTATASPSPAPVWLAWQPCPMPVRVRGPRGPPRLR